MRVFGKQSNRTTRNITLSGTSACCFVSAAPRGLSYQASDKTVRASGLSDMTVVYTTVSLGAW